MSSMEMKALPKGWEWKKLGEVCKMYQPKTISKKQMVSDGYYSVYGANGIIGRYNEYNHEESQLLITCRGATCGTVNISKPKSWINGNAMVINPLNDKLLSIDFLKYAFLGFINLKKIISGAAQPQITRKSLNPVKIPIPPLAEQQKIVTLLDEAFAQIQQAQANIEQNIVNAKELFQSKLNEIFSQRGDGWEEKKMKELGVIQTGSTPRTKDKSNYGNFIPFIKPPHFNTDGTIDSGESMLSKKGLDNGRLIQANSILMVCIGATIGKTGFVTKPASSNQQINALTPKSDFFPKMLYYALISPFVQNQVLRIGKRAQATLPIINKTKWSNLNVNIPILKSEQIKVVETLDNILNFTIEIEKTYQQKLDNLEELKKSLLEKAFSGALTRDSITAS